MESVAEIVGNHVVAPLIIEAKNKVYQSDKLDDRTSQKAFALLNRISDSSLTVFDKDLDAFCSVEVYNPIKTFGVFTLIEDKATFDYEDLQTGLVLKKGDPYLSIHLSPRGEDITTKRIHWSLRKVGLYLENFKEKLPALPVIGMTYHRLASASRRYGFTLPSTPLPSEAKEEFIKQHQASLKDKWNIELSDVALCFQTYNQFIEQWGKPLKLGT